MRKLSFFFALIMLSTELFAETQDLWQSNPACYGFQVGYLGKSITATSQGETLTTSVFGASKTFTPSGRFAFVANPTFGYGLGLRTGVGVEYGREKVLLLGELFNLGGSMIDLSIPLQVSFTIQPAKDLYVGIYTGPNFDFGLSKQFNSSSLNMYYSYDEEGKMESYSGFSCQWGAGAMVQWKCLRLDLGTEWGIYSQMSNLYSADKLLVNNPIYATVSIMFGGNYLSKKARQ